MSAEPLRRTGRPDQQASEELLRHIIETASRLFIDQGYAATSIEQIAAAAGSGKQTLYRRFGSKEALFTEVINYQGQRLIDIAQKAEANHPNPIEALKETSRLLFDFVQQPDMVRLHRTLLAEIGRFPDLGDYVLDNCMGPFKTLFKRLLSAAINAGQVRIADTELANALLSSLMTGWPTQQALLGREPFASPAEREAYFDGAWSLFLNGAR
jgi:AcrR family transcriptional regulator